MAPVGGQKRKVAYLPSDALNQARKRQKGKDAKAIPTQTADAALSKTGELNIGQFIKSREFEIAALEQSMKKARKSLTQRAFQQVPRHMRRRTASHNVKKIPRRLRARAAKEILEDNTPTGSARTRKPSSKLRLRIQTARKLQRLNAKRKTVRQKKREAKQNAKESDPQKHVDVERAPRVKKNQLAKPPQAIVKYKRRQVNKTWLPTHLWHTKRAHMTRPMMPLWRLAIPLKPTEKTFRPSHRASTARGCIAWDTSYISTIGCQGTENALEGMLKSLRFTCADQTETKLRKWRIGARFSEGWAYERDCEKRCIAPILVFWQANAPVDALAASQEADMIDIDAESLSTKGAEQAKKAKKSKLNHRLLIRVHPSAFHQFWLELLKVAKMQKPQVLVEDLRFEIGSIDIQGPSSTEALVGVLRIADRQPLMERVWPTLAALSNPSSLPRHAMLSFDTIDPRLNHPPPQISVARGDASANKLNETIVAWPFDKTFPSSDLFDYKKRYHISNSLPTQKAINRRRGALLPGHQLEPSEQDPRIPTILLACRSSKKDSNSQGSWTVLLPWSCVDPVWRSLMYYPLTSGSTPRLGGLEQIRQVASEQTIPWFPGDYPGTEAGKAWDRTESEKRFDEWIRRPPSKRIAWDALGLGPGEKGELGRGWACDWEYLFHDASPETKKQSSIAQNPSLKPSRKSSEPQLLTQRQRKAAAKKGEREESQQEHRRNTSSPDCEGDDDYETLYNDVKFTQLTPIDAAALLNTFKLTTLPPKPVLFTVRIRYLTRGTPTPTARIYRIPIQEATDVGCKPGANQTSGDDPSRTSPALFSLTRPQSTNSPSALRARWLALDPNPTLQTFNPNSSTNLPKHHGGQKYNHSSLPVAARAYDPKVTRDLSHIRVFPPRETKPEVLNMFGPKPPRRTKEVLEKLYVPQLVPKMVVNSNGELVEETLWDKHVPCPGPGDLLGYVTSGGYNLAEGVGTAIGGLWVQRLVEGWRAEEGLTMMQRGERTGDEDSQGQSTGETSSNGDHRKISKQELDAEKRRAGEARKQQKRIDRQRHLCIVRNAGESIGRLAIWELC